MRMNQRSDFVNFNRTGNLSFTGNATNEYNALARQESRGVRYSVAACNYPDEAVVPRRTDTQFSDVSRASYVSIQPYSNDGAFKEKELKQHKWNNRNRLV